MPAIPRCYSCANRATIAIIAKQKVVVLGGVVALQSKHARAWALEAFAERGDEVQVYDVRISSQRKAHTFAATALDLAKLREHRQALRRAKQVVFVCETGRESYLAARAASHMGCAGAGYLSGGLQAWREAGA